MSGQTKRLIKKLIPRGIIVWRHKLRHAKLEHQETGLPLHEVFNDIYQSNRWGGAKGEFYSGVGSDDDVTVTYVAQVRNFIREHNVRSIVDLGCGDFRVGAKIVNASDVRYQGLDIVDALIAHNNAVHGSDGVSFACCNAVTDPLPRADLCLIRQVLQHLSNEQINAILAKLHIYKYVLVAEHQPAKQALVPNKDKVPGSGIRLLDNSAVYLDLPPFSLPNAKVLFESPLHEKGWKGDLIRTYLITN